MLFLKKKREIPKIRVGCDLKLTKEYKEWYEALRAEFRMTRQEVMYEGAASMLEKKKYVIDCIWAGDYLVLHKNVKGNKLSLTGRGCAPKTKMYVYHVDMLEGSRYRLFYKDNGDREDTAFKVWKTSKTYLPKEVEKEFPMTVRTGIPSNE